MALSKVILLNIAVVFVYSIQPNCEPDNQFRSYCFSIEFCNDFGCRDDNCGRFFVVNTKLVKIKKATIIPNCAFSNADQLKYVEGANKDIEVIASGAFVNLPRMEGIILPFNLIKELHQGIFKNVSLASLDLSWNRIVYIQEGAFEGIDGLKYLNLSKNELFTLPVQRLSPSLINLNLSHNFLEILAVNYARFPNLTKIDFSNNELEHIALFFQRSMEEIDLTSNKLDNIDLFEVRHCERLKIQQNQFSFVPEFLKYASIKNVSLHPNPWRCNELKKLWEYLQNNFVNVEDLQSQEGKPICSDHVSLTGLDRIVGQKYCIDDSECDGTELCRRSVCSNPCDNNVCDEGSKCVVDNHKFECLCPGVLKRDPRNIYSPCVNVQCFLERHCNDGQMCNYDHVCQIRPATMFEYSYVPIAIDVPKEEPLPWWFYEIPRLPISSNRSRD